MTLGVFFIFFICSQRSSYDLALPYCICVFAIKKKIKKVFVELKCIRIINTLIKFKSINTKVEKKKETNYKM